MSRERLYSVLDVFAERALEGNPLAVFHDGSGLSDATMQAIARETNLSETTFVLRRDAETERREGVRVRIFTTREELPFAGHPTLGTATWLYRNDPALRASVDAGGSLTLHLNVGPIAVQFSAPVAGEAGVLATMHHNDPVFGATFTAEEVAAATGLDAASLLPGHPPQSVSTGNSFCIVALRSLEALTALAIPEPGASLWLRERGIRWFYCIAPDSSPDAAPDTSSHTAPETPFAQGPCVRWRARMQFNGSEDPATGSAAGPCIAWLVRQGLAPADTDVVLQQGVEINRPSRIVTRASMRGSEVHSVTVAGRTIPVAEGRLFLP